MFTISVDTYSAYLDRQLYVDFKICFQDVNKLKKHTHIIQKLISYFHFAQNLIYLICLIVLIYFEKNDK